MDIPSLSSSNLPTMPAQQASAVAGTTPPAAPVTASQSVTAVPGTGSVAQTNASGSGNKDPLQQAIKEVQDALSPVARDLRFSIDEDSGATVIKIMDSATNKVVKQIPSEEMLRISQALEKLQGLLLNQTA